MPYQYTNPGVAAARGMDRFLAEREVAKRQQMLDDIAMRREKRLADSDAAEMKMRQEEIKDRQAARKDAADLRERQFKLQEESAAEKAKVGREKTWLTREKHKQKGDIPDPSFIELAREFDPESLEEPGSDYQLPPEAQGPVPSTGPIRFGGRPDELAAEATRKRQQAFVNTLPAGNIRTRAEGKMVGLDLPAETADRAIGDVKEVGGYIYTQAPDGQWIKGERAQTELGAGTRTPPVTRYSRAEVMVDGKSVLANYDALTGQYTDETGKILKGLSAARTADQKNVESKRDMTTRSVNAVRALSAKVITKIGPGQRAQAVQQGAEAVLGHNPEWRTYRDSRMALAGNLAVLQQGSRPSDADIKSIWLPLVPDVFADTTESAALKWEMIATMSGVELDDLPTPTPVAAKTPQQLRQEFLGRKK